MNKKLNYHVDHPAVAGVSCPVCLVRPGKRCVVGAYGTKLASHTHKGRVDRYQAVQRSMKKVAKIPKAANAPVSQPASVEELPTPAPVTEPPAA
jgi:hypothetical protein